MRITIRILTVVFIISGIGHLIAPEGFLALMPTWLPEPIALIYLSGVLELVCAAGLLFKKSWAGWLSAVVLIGVWPANIWFALSVIPAGDTWTILIAWLRLPLQIPLIYYSVRFARIS